MSVFHRRGRRKVTTPTSPQLEDPKDFHGESRLRKSRRWLTTMISVAVLASVTALFILGRQYVNSHRSSESLVVDTEDGDLDIIRVGHLRGRTVEDNRLVKIVALVEVRNVFPVLTFFLSALSQVVDSIVVLDDHSSDETVPFTKRIGRKHQVELVIAKRGTWQRREEMRDRNILLKYGRSVGGTHFVLLDYDEFFSANCAANGFLRNKISQLKPGESLNLPWLEAWKSPRWHRVLAEDRSMNFLRRRQAVVFADDGSFRYEAANSLSRSLGEESATIHTLKCPRGLCDLPKKGEKGAKSDRKLARECAIVEMKFVNVDNAVLKSAWYEALGRRAQAPDNVVRGKMFDVLFGSSDQPPAEKEVLLRIPDEYLNYAEWNESLFDAIELWRADEILRWGSENAADGGLAKLLVGLPASETVDWKALEGVLSGGHRNINSLPALPRTLVGKVTFLLCEESVPASLRDHAMKLLGGLDQTTLSLSVKGGKSDSFLELVEDAGYIRNALNTGRLRQGTKATGREYLVVTARGYAAAMHSAILGLRHLGDIQVSFMLLHWGPQSSTRANNLDPVVEWLRENVPRYFHASMYQLDALATLSLSYAARANAVIGLEPVGSWPKYIQSAKQVRQKLLESNLAPPESIPKLGEMVFSINAGRSGSRFLADVIKTVNGGSTISLHEPACPEKKCSSGGAMRMQDVSLEESYAERQAVKLNMILREIESCAAQMATNQKVTTKAQPLGNTTSQGTFELLRVDRHGAESYKFDKPLTYVETNPNFKSWFFDIVLRELVEPFAVTVLVLRKWPPALVRSIYETGFFSDRDGYQWMETANSVNSHVQPLDRDAELSPVELIISYVLNTEAFVQYFGSQPEAQKTRLINWRSEDLFREDQAIQLLSMLGMEPTAETHKVVNEVHDKYTDENHPLRSKVGGEKNEKLRMKEISLGKCERAWQNYLQVAADRGISLPECVGRAPGFDYGGD